jgi:hypothetical protein
VAAQLGLQHVYAAANPRPFRNDRVNRLIASMVRRRVDHVFVCPGEAFQGKVLSSRIVLNTPQELSDGSRLWPSDHYGVLAELEVIPPNRRP